MRRSLALLACATTLALSGCGVQQADLFALDRAGGGPGARLALVVSDDGSVTCNRGRSRPLPPQLLLDARDLGRRVAPDAAAHRRYPPRPHSVFSYFLRSQDGSVTWSDTSRPLPETEFRLAFLARKISQQACGLAR